MTKGVLIGRGRTAEVYAWGDGRALKLYYEGWPADEAEREAHTARVVYDSGAAAPAVEGVVTVDGRHGVVYERVDGPSLLNKTTAQPWTLIRSARLLSELHVHMHTCRVSALPSQRTRLEKKIQAAYPLPAILKQAALDALTQLPDDDALCHGDFHPDNVVMSQGGPIILDWVDATCGYPLADVARTSLLMQMAALPPDLPGRRLIELGRALWHHLYLRRYCQLRAVSSEQVTAWMLPVVAARLSEGIAEEEKLLIARVRALLRKMALPEPFSPKRHSLA